MKICFITTNIFNLGGVQRVLTVIANELSKEHQVDILCVKGAENINRDLYNLSEEVNVDINKKLLPTNFIVKAIYKICREINKKTGILNKEEHLNKIVNIYYPKCTQDKFIEYINYRQYDVVIGVQGEFSLLLGVIKEKLNCRIMGWQHNSYDAYFKNKSRYLWNQDIMVDKFIPKLDKYIVLTKYDEIMFERERNIKTVTIHNPRSFKSKEKSECKDKVFLAAGRFNHQKGFDLLIKSFNIFAKNNSEWKLIIVGDGEDKEKILNLIKNYGLEKQIEVCGFTDDIKKYFLSASALLLSSRWEGMPMIVLESLEMGVPIISYDITAILELVENDKEGIIVPKYDIDAFAKAMIEISKSYDLRKSMSKRCIEKSKMFDIEKIIEKWNENLI